MNLEIAALTFPYVIYVSDIKPAISYVLQVSVIVKTEYSYSPKGGYGKL